jgi:CubicO group peptidase (beta-lactamase class C family)
MVRNAYEASLRDARDPATLSGRAFLGTGERSALDDLGLIFNNPAVLRGELPAGGGTATARALARVWALQVGGGELDGVRVLSEQSVEQWSRVVSNVPDLLMAEVPLPRMMAGKEQPVPRTTGYLGNGAMPGLGHRFGPRPDAFGVEGLGGQFGFCDRSGGIAVGYVRSDLALVDVLQPTVTRELYRCAAELGHDVQVGPRPSRVQGALVRRTMAARA